MLEASNEASEGARAQGRARVMTVCEWAAALG